MDINGKNKGQKLPRQPNPLEAFKDDLKDIGAETAKKMRSEAAKLPGDFMEQLLGIRSGPKNFSGEIVPGEAIEFSEILSGRYEEVKKAKKQVSFERRLLEEERVQVEKKTNELRMQLTAIREEILFLAQKTEDLAEETQVAAFQAPVEPGIYHVIFFEKLLEFVKSFRRKIEEASIWLHAVNRRAARKNVWGANYKKSGAKYLLSGEHYLQRSAG
ncbi:hypothetical protein A2865_04145 [Candidatus Woesebacteria bacterium RIFCSPHIGHO2_01_FULL_39_17]|uniref:DUF5660 domain-containing protein n=3 Tax=Candidatus Woeseibacteriota TaxID=1752722 RepID=A0A0G0NDK4_9BACT|nr:MAG: hypothetical protein US72_C0005G0080 [Microgenomates group bacterium GW2011_GWC1_38_12]KKQ94277.1 MAG: hypothetical protein UT19_C0003G0082 [Candidatus Woesebacteria bacterium GW2011_GWB1_39_10b]KKR14214.1 MAG: hypothetical protein UT40_C0004G0037 [Candidatus Woesebacteria bacterium GW2011_GWA1_39_21b]OGM22648.1 MAG: hypothetical protein A2865_04145 [Candidatus Woesebacteria bacterium RIFCSPHIGHO2_01_FULL_39_17]OGM63583.1 MAG: hypothetical protein A3A52_01185 [Candidatus Woesebacteria b